MYKFSKEKNAHLISEIFEDAEEDDGIHPSIYRLMGDFKNIRYSRYPKFSLRDSSSLP